MGCFYSILSNVLTSHENIRQCYRHFTRWTLFCCENGIESNNVLYVNEWIYSGSSLNISNEELSTQMCVRELSMRQNRRVLQVIFQVCVYACECFHPTNGCVQCAQTNQHNDSNWTEMTKVQNVCKWLCTQKCYSLFLWFAIKLNESCNFFPLERQSSLACWM